MYMEIFAEGLKDISDVPEAFYKLAQILDNRDILFTTLTEREIPKLIMEYETIGRRNHGLLLQEPRATEAGTDSEEFGLLGS